MARLLLVASGAIWLAAGLAGLVLAAIGTERLERLLPPLVIDTDAIRAAIVSVAVAFILVALAHGAVVLGLRARHELAWTAGILMSAVLAALFVALAAAAAASAAAEPERALAYLAATVVAVIGAVAYVIVTVRLVGERRSGSTL
ncbi:MAG TPA: hypothetical protein VIZ22_01395 [Candidatus Limnocylindrales bacterium]